MAWMRIVLLLQIVFIEKSIGDNIRSLMMSIMPDQQFQCADTTCLPFTTRIVSTIRDCQLACLANDQCQAASFHQSTSNCQLFKNAFDQNVNMLIQTDVVAMIVISGTRIPSVTTIIHALVNPCSNGIYWNVTGSTVAGTGIAGSGYNQLNNSYGIYLDSSDSLYISDYGNQRVMKYLYGASNGSLIAGMTNISGSGLNQLRRPTFLYVDSSQTLYVSDAGNHRVMRWLNGASNGSIVAGNGTAGSSLNQLGPPFGVWVDSSSNVFVAEYGNHRVTKWSLNASTGILVAGISNVSGNTSDRLSYPTGLVYDEINQDLYICNWGAHTIMRWRIGNSTGTVIAGVPGVSGSNTTLLNAPVGITLDQWKNLYVTDFNNHRIQLFCYGNKTGITIAGTSTGGSSVFGPTDVKLDSQMNLYVSESTGHRVTKFNKL